MRSLVDRQVNLARMKALEDMHIISKTGFTEHVKKAFEMEHQRELAKALSGKSSFWEGMIASFFAGLLSYIVIVILG